MSYAQKITRFETFKKFLALQHNGEQVNFVKGNKRAFAPTSLGTVFLSRAYNPKKSSWIMMHSGGVGKDGTDYTHLKDSLWLCNAELSEYDITQHVPLDAEEKATAKKKRG